MSRVIRDRSAPRLLPARPAAAITEPSSEVITQAITQAITELSGDRDRSSEQALLRLAVAGAEKLLGAELRLDPGRIEHLLEDLMRRAQAQRSLRLLLHPEDLAALDREAWEGRAKLIADPSIERGGALLLTEHGRVDGRLSVRLRALEAALGIEPSQESHR